MPSTDEKDDDSKSNRSLRSFRKLSVQRTGTAHLQQNVSEAGVSN